MKAMSFSALVRDFFSSAFWVASDSLKLLRQGWAPILLVMSGGLIYSLVNLFLFVSAWMHWTINHSIVFGLCFICFFFWCFCVNAAFNFWYTYYHEGRRMGFVEMKKEGMKHRFAEMVFCLMFLFALFIIFCHFSLLLAILAFCFFLVLPPSVYYFKKMTYAFSQSMWCLWERPLLFLCCVLMPVLLNFIMSLPISLVEKVLLDLQLSSVLVIFIKSFFFMFFCFAALFCFSWYLTIGIVLASRYIPVQFPRIYLKRQVKLREGKKVFASFMKKITAFTESCDDESDVPTDNNKTIQSDRDRSRNDKKKP